MDAAADDGAAGRDRFQCLGHERAGRGKDEGGVERLRGQGIGAAGPGRTDAPREILPGDIARAGEGKNLAPLLARDLADDVSSGAETINTQPFRVARLHQAAIADQSGAEQRRGVGIGVGVGNGETKRSSATVYSA